uniref:ANF_receptor domain-containing protein n=1 Tax=Globodera pallida TaxID=36090 RepID=A0A183CF81_GLOPA
MLSPTSSRGRVGEMRGRNPAEPANGTRASTCFISVEFNLTRAKISRNQSHFCRPVQHNPSPKGGHFTQFIRPPFQHIKELAIFRLILDANRRAMKGYEIDRLELGVRTITEQKLAPSGPFWMPIHEALKRSPNRLWQKLTETRYQKTECSDESAANDSNSGSTPEQNKASPGKDCAMSIPHSLIVRICEFRDNDADDDSLPPVLERFFGKFRLSFLDSNDALRLARVAEQNDSAEGSSNGEDVDGFLLFHLTLKDYEQMPITEVFWLTFLPKNGTFSLNSFAIRFNTSKELATFRSILDANPRGAKTEPKQIVAKLAETRSKKRKCSDESAANDSNSEFDTRTEQSFAVQFYGSLGKAAWVSEASRFCSDSARTSEETLECEHCAQSWRFGSGLSFCRARSADSAGATTGGTILGVSAVLAEVGAAQLAGKTVIVLSQNKKTRVFAATASGATNGTLMDEDENFYVLTGGSLKSPAMHAHRSDRESCSSNSTNCGRESNGEYALVYLDTDYNCTQIRPGCPNRACIAKCNSRAPRDEPECGFQVNCCLEMVQCAHSLTEQGVTHCCEFCDFGCNDSASSARAHVRKKHRGHSISTFRHRQGRPIISTPVQLNIPELKEFWRKANAYLPRFGGFNNNETSIIANRYACYLYDAMMLYAQALDETIQDRLRVNGTAAEAINDGARIVSRILGRTYRSVQGFDMRIDINGDAEGNYTLLALQDVLNQSHHNYYPLNQAMDIVADFVANANPAQLPILRMHRQVQWPTGRTPRDEPECGFHNEKCRPVEPEMADRPNARDEPECGFHNEK